MAEPGPAEAFEDFPLQTGSGPEASAIARAEAVSGESARRSDAAAPLGPRLSAAAADFAAVLLLTAAALLAARLVTGATPRAAGIPWILGFLLYLSLFTTVPPLVLFGRTIGMAISELSVRPGAEPGISASAALRRWAGTLAAAATAGLILVWSGRDAERPTPADRFSGRSLALD
jgi:RDD family